jgi:CheY-like chemotaxis protein
VFNILLVDDDSVDVMTLQRAFRKHPIMKKAKLLTAKSGKDALDKLLSGEIEEPSIVLLDLNMPEMGGLQFLEHVRSNPQLAKLRVIVLTTSADKNDINQATDKCIVGYIKKAKAGDYTTLTELIYHYCSLTES